VAGIVHSRKRDIESMVAKMERDTPLMKNLETHLKLATEDLEVSNDTDLDLDPDDRDRDRDPNMIWRSMTVPNRRLRLMR